MSAVHQPATVLSSQGFTPNVPLRRPVQGVAELADELEPARKPPEQPELF